MTRHKRAHSAGVLPKAKSVRKAQSPAVTVSDTNTNFVDDEVVAVGSQPQSQSQSSINLQLSQPSDISDDMLNLDDRQMCIKNLQAHLVNLSKTVVELRETVRKQQIAINQLTAKCYKVSPVGVDAVNCTDGTVNISESSLPPAPTDLTTSYATVVASPVLHPAATNPTLTTSVRRAVLTAVHSELRNKQSRERNIVITGLCRSNVTQDKDLVSKLLFEELGFIDVKIIQCKRFGKSPTMGDGRPQPLRIILQSPVDAHDILASAKSLRRSTDDHIRSNVFINPDLTRAEAEAAYNMRCARRRARQSNVSTVCQSETASHSSTLQSSAADPTGNRRSTTQAVLDPAAVPFVSQQSSA